MRFLAVAALASLFASSLSAADLKVGDFQQGRRLAEIMLEILCVIDQAAIGAKGGLGKPVQQRAAVMVDRIVLRRKFGQQGYGLRSGGQVPPSTGFVARCRFLAHQCGSQRL